MPEVKFIAFGDDARGHNLLPEEAVKLWIKIEKYLNVQWKTGDKYRLSLIDGCLKKLEATLLQVYRIKQSYNSLLKSAKQQKNKKISYSFFRGDTACTDFESLLFHSRATLDILTWFLSKEFKNSCSSYRSLPNILQDHAPKSETAKKLIDIHEKSIKLINGLLSTVEQEKSLRDFIAHLGPASAKMENCFGIVFTNQRKAILFDCELDGHPVFRIASQSAQYISFIVLNMIAATLGEEGLSLEQLACKWVPKTIVLSESLVEEPKGSPHREPFTIVVKKTNPDGFDAQSVNIKPDIYKSAINLDTA